MIVHGFLDKIILEQEFELLINSIMGGAGMVYYLDEEVLIRTMIETDPKVICKEELAQGWQANEESIAIYDK